MGVFNRSYLPLFGIGAGVLLAMILARKIDLLPPAGELFQSAAGGMVDAANGVLSGTVQGIGLVVGIPKTDVSKCQQDIQAGEMWEASFSCPAKTFLSAAWDKL